MTLLENSDDNFTKTASINPQNLAPFSSRQRSLPGSTISGIQMNKIRFGIIPHAASTKINSHVPEMAGGKIPDSDVNGPAFHVQAFLGHPPTSFPQCPVGFRGSIAGNHLNDTMASTSILNGTDNIKQSRINGMDRFGAKIPQKLVYFPLIATGSHPQLMADIKVFSGVGMKKGKGSVHFATCQRNQRGTDEKTGHGAGGELEELTSSYFSIHISMVFFPNFEPLLNVNEPVIGPLTFLPHHTWI